jgi:hypothetical protein
MPMAGQAGHSPGVCPGEGGEAAALFRIDLPA